MPAPRAAAALLAVLWLPVCSARAELPWGMDTPLPAGGVVWLGEDGDDRCAWAVAGAGDVDGDGFDDVLVGAPDHAHPGGGSGAAYLVLGRPVGWLYEAPLVQADATFRRAVEAAVGYAVAGAGDVDGDGLDDLLIGAPLEDVGGAGVGRAYLVPGRASGWTAEMDLADAGTGFYSDPDENVGVAVGGLGDVDGDGLDDFAFGATREVVGDHEGHLYLFLGRAGGWPLELIGAHDADAAIAGEAGLDGAGGAFDGGGDVDGDGLDDLVVGVAGSDAAAPEAGQVYLLLGRSQGWDALSDLGDADASWTGEVEDDRAGGVVALAGDVDGDGLADLLAGAPQNDEVANKAGKAYLILGRAAGWAMGGSLADADATFLGEDAEDFSGMVAGAGDVDGDGLDDLLIGAYSSDDGGGGAGQAYLWLGREAGWAPGLALADADASFLGGAVNEGAGTSLAGAGDVDGDGLGDLLIGAPWGDGVIQGAGRAYLVLRDLACPDADGDGATTCDGDCNDADPAVLPGADEACNGRDDDCDGLVDEGFDADGDGWTTCAGDCDDGDPAAHPGAAEVCGGADEDCDGAVDEGFDADGDGFLDCPGDDRDCNDADPAVFPGADEVCNGRDDDCDGHVDEDGVCPHGDDDDAGDEPGGCGGCTAGAASPAAPITTVLALAWLAARRLRN